VQTANQHQSPVKVSAPQLASSSLPMKLGCQSGPTDTTHLQYFARYGVTSIFGYPNIADGRLYATVEELQRMLDLAGNQGISVEGVALPFLTSSHIDHEPHPAIMLGHSPQRDRDIEAVQLMIVNCASVGIPAIKYNLSLLGWVRSGETPGRGDAKNNSWRLHEAQPASPLTRAGIVNAEQYWERIDYFLSRVILVAEQHRIRMACHPHDPGMPTDGYQGVDCVLGTVDGLKRFVSMHESSWHGLNFCIGTVAEMMQNPAEEIFDVIRYFGEKRKIFNVHLRNIRGRRDSFEEVFPDEGDIDFVRVVQTLHEVSYPHLIMPDHVPRAASDPGSLQSFAFCYGYIRALLQAVSAQTSGVHNEQPQSLARLAGAEQYYAPRTHR
jgi:mannonate dehydratase